MSGDRLRSPLRDRVTAAFSRADALLGTSPATRSTRDVLRAHRERFAAPLRVALVGRVSAGKSTLVNALLGKYRAPTGIEELTFNVNWLRYGRDPHVLIHFLGGADPERRDIEELEKLTVRARHDPGLQEYLSRVDYLEVLDPAPELRHFEIVDTPGLDAAFAQDATNTLRFLGRSPDDIRAASLDHASRADAMILVFSAAVHAREAELLADFTGAGLGAAAPVTTVGALTKIESFWPQADPLTEGRRVADSVMTSAGATRLLFDLRPVASLVAAGAATLTDEDYCNLAALATVEPGLLARRAGRAEFFAHRDYDDMPVPAPRRAALLRKMERYGVVLACQLLRDGVDTIADLRAELLERSGLNSFRDLLLAHFGNRADVIKLDRVIQDVKKLRTATPAGMPPQDAVRMRDAVNAISELEYKEHVFAELAVLRDFYADRIHLAPDEVTDLLNVTGERGHQLADRLGLPPGTQGQVALEAARRRLSHWAGATEDPFNDQATRNAARVVRRSYDYLISDLQGESPVPGRG